MRTISYISNYFTQCRYYLIVINKYKLITWIVPHENLELHLTLRIAVHMFVVQSNLPIFTILLFRFIWTILSALTGYVTMRTNMWSISYRVSLFALFLTLCFVCRPHVAPAYVPIHISIFVCNLHI